MGKKTTQADKPLLIMQTGNASSHVRQKHGDYDRMFIQMGAIETLAARGGVKCLNVERGERPEQPRAYAGVLVTGSDAMVTDRLPWSEAAAGWLRGALDAGLPILGVCYGHQLLAHALGGVVDYHPGGMELGTHEIFLHPPAAQEPELAGFPPRFDANLFHSQTVMALPPNTTVLAGSAHDPHQLLRYAPMVWSTQFHPEFDGGIMRVLVEEEKKRENPVASRANVADAPYARLFLQRIVSKMVGADE